MNRESTYSARYRYVIDYKTTLLSALEAKSALIINLRRDVIKLNNDNESRSHVHTSGLEITNNFLDTRYWETRLQSLK